MSDSLWTVLPRGQGVGYGFRFELVAEAGLVLELVNRRTPRREGCLGRASDCLSHSVSPK